VRLSFRDGFFVGTAVALIGGFYAVWLWQPDRQVQLHTKNLIHQIENRDWPTVRNSLAADYRDDWDNDRERLIERLREVLHYARNIRITWVDPHTRIEGRNAFWIANVKVHGNRGEAIAIIEDRINSLSTPFGFEWRRESVKPWDWKLTRVSNNELRIGREEY
jgi:hypothetical protein